MSSQNESVLLDFQKLLEHNEDILAAVVENFQLDRMEDCISHYLILQSNLISLGNELDNYPAGDTDPYGDVVSFPDEIMRKDILDDLLPHGSRALPKPPNAPPCWKCACQNISSVKCRVTLGHVDPSSTFCSSELEEFFHAAEVLGADHRQHSIAAITAQRNREKNKHTHTHNTDDESYEESNASGTYSQSLIHVKKSGGGESRANSRMGKHSKDAHAHSHLSYGNTSSNSDGSYVASSPPYTDTCNNSNSSSRGVHGEKGRTAMSAADIRNHRYNTGLLDPDSDSWGEYPSGDPLDPSCPPTPSSQGNEKMKGRGKGRGDWVHLMGLAAANHLLEVAPSAHNLVQKSSGGVHDRSGVKVKGTGSGTGPKWSRPKGSSLKGKSRGAVDMQAVHQLIKDTSFKGGNNAAYNSAMRRREEEERAAQRLIPRRPSDSQNDQRYWNKSINGNGNGIVGGSAMGSQHGNASGDAVSKVSHGPVETFAYLLKLQLQQQQQQQQQSSVHSSSVSVHLDQQFSLDGFEDSNFGFEFSNQGVQGTAIAIPNRGAENNSSGSGGDSKRTASSGDIMRGLTNTNTTAITVTGSAITTGTSTGRISQRERESRCGVWGAMERDRIPSHSQFSSGARGNEKMNQINLMPPPTALYSAPSSSSSSSISLSSAPISIPPGDSHTPSSILRALARVPPFARAGLKKRLELQLQQQQLQQQGLGQGRGHCEAVVGSSDHDDLSDTHHPLSTDLNQEQRREILGTQWETHRQKKKLAVRNGRMSVRMSLERSAEAKCFSEMCHSGMSIAPRSNIGPPQQQQQHQQYYHHVGPPSTTISSSITRREELVEGARAACLVVQDEEYESDEMQDSDDDDEEEEESNDTGQR